MIIKQRGNSIITTPIIIAIGIMLLSALIVLVVKIITPYIWYEKLSSTCIKYIFIMEEYGYLTKAEQAKLLNELKDQGFDEKDIQISCTQNVQEYGKPIFLEVKYEYDLKLPGVNDNKILMKIDRQSISKR